MKQKVPCTLMEGSVFSLNIFVIGMVCYITLENMQHLSIKIPVISLHKTECTKSVVNSRIHGIGKKAAPLHI